MAWVRFGRRWAWRVPGPRLVQQVYTAGRAYPVKADVARAAVADGAAARIKAPPKGVDPNAEGFDGAGSDDG